MASGFINTSISDVLEGRIQWESTWIHGLANLDELTPDSPTSDYKDGYYERVDWTVHIRIKSTSSLSSIEVTSGRACSFSYQFGSYDTNNGSQYMTRTFTKDWVTLNAGYFRTGRYKLDETGKYNATGALQVEPCTYTSNVNTSSKTYPITISGMMILDTITEDGVITSSPSKISTSASAYIGDDANIVITSSDISFTHSVYYSYDGGDTKVLIGDEKRTDTNFTWTIPESYYQQIPSSKSGTIDLYVETYNSYNEWLGEESTSIQALTVESVCSPSLSPTIYDTNDFTVSLTGNSSILVADKSFVTYKANATSRKYASIVHITVQNGSQTLTGETNTFKNSVTNQYRFTVQDSRGYTATALLTPEMIAYIPLTCVLKVEAPSVSGEMDFTISGNYYNSTIGNITNSLGVYYRLKGGEADFGEWTQVSYELTDNKYTCQITVEGLNYTVPYTVEAYAVDVFGNVYSLSQTVSTIPTFDWGMSDFNMNVPMTVFGSLTVNGDVTVTGSINGTQGSGGSGGTHYGTCQTAADTKAKLVTSSTFTSFTNGASIRVKFGYENTIENPTLSVNGTGTAPIVRYNGVANMIGAWKVGEVKDFVYDGANWIMVDGGESTKTPITSFVMQSPNGTNFTISINDNGEFVIT